MAARKGKAYLDPRTRDWYVAATYSWWKEHVWDVTQADRQRISRFLERMRYPEASEMVHSMVSPDSVNMLRERKLLVKEA